MPIVFRPITPDDTPTLFALSERAIGDLARRLGHAWDNDPDDPVLWARRRPLFEHLAATADQAWVAEDAGQVIGYARSIRRGANSARELTEFFVLPGHQSAGVGRELLARAFPADTERRFIVATTDTRALVRYLKTGVSAHFPIFEFRRAPEAVPPVGALQLAPMDAGSLSAVAAVDEAVLGYRRDEDHAWFAQQRNGFVARREGQVVGYGYVGDEAGPLAVLAPADMPALLAHAETLAHARGQGSLSFEVPLINRAAVAHLLGRGYSLHTFFAFFMAAGPLGKFENYVLFSPPFFI